MHGKAYYSSNVLNKIGVFNGLDRRLVLYIYNKKGKLIYKISSEAVEYDILLLSSSNSCRI